MYQLRPPQKGGLMVFVPIAFILAVMVQILRQQYQLVQSSRSVVLQFIAEQNIDVNAPITAFHDKTVGFILLHVANVYKHWLGNFGMGSGLSYYDDSSATEINAIRGAFADADKVVDNFLHKFQHDLDLPIIGTLPGNRQFTFTPVELFTHVITHEFHHKGQVMSMCSLLGHTPPDTDLIRT